MCIMQKSSSRNHLSTPTINISIEDGLKRRVCNPINVRLKWFKGRFTLSNLTYCCIVTLTNVVVYWFHSPSIPFVSLYQYVISKENNWAYVPKHREGMKGFIIFLKRNAELISYFSPNKQRPYNKAYFQWIDSSSAIGNIYMRYIKIYWISLFTQNLKLT